MTEHESFQRMEREVYGNSSYLFAGETNLEPWEKEEEEEVVFDIK